MTVINRYSITDRVALSFTGNTLGLIGTFNPSLATTSGAADGIGTFTTINTGLQSPGGYPVGTTQTFSQNSSSAILNFLSGSTILYAELAWSGVQSNALQNVSSSVNNTVALTTPLGTTFNISPDPATSQSITNIFGLISPYGRSANVTNIVKAAGAGTYTVSGVPCALGGTSSTTSGSLESNYLGWTLAIVYRNQSLNYRNLNLWVLFEGVQQNSMADVPISGFATSGTGAISSRIAVSVGSGDSYLSGDTLQFGPTTASLTTLFGPNNSISNFFASQINFADSQNANVGQLNTTGTFGNNNQPIGSKSLNGRQGWDITNVDTSSAMVNNQTSAIIRFMTTGDVYVPTVLGLQIDVNSANLTPITKIVDKPFAIVGDVLTYTITFKNGGLVTANNSIFIDTIPTGTSFVDNSLVINNVNQSSSPAPPGILIGNIAPNQATTISFKVVVSTIPSPSTIINQSGVGYNFISAPTLNAIPAFDSSNFVTTTIVSANLASSKIVNKTYANIGDILTYTIPITNTGNATALSINFIDTIPNGTSFVSGSFTQNGTVIPSTPNPPGVILNNIGIGQTSTIVFKVKVDTFPSQNPIPNAATMVFTYTIDSSTIPNRIGTNSSNTNIVRTIINNANLNSSSKLVNKTYATCGDILTYTINMLNSGNVTAQNVLFKDTIPNGTIFVPNSVYVNGSQVVGGNPSIGVTIPNISPQGVASITFNVQVVC